VRNNSTATTAYASTLATPTPPTFIARPMVHTSEIPMVTTSPEVTRRGSAAPSRVACTRTASAVRRAAAMRSLVIDRCRMMPSPALLTPTSNTTAVQASSVAGRRSPRPRSMAWDNRYGMTASVMNHNEPNIAPSRTRPFNCLASRNR
jgi:hypothetical protein